MGYSSYPPASGGKTRYLTSLTSGTSYTVPAGVTYLNVTCIGGGGGATSGRGPADYSGGAGGTTSFTGATSASGGNPGNSGDGNSRPGATGIGGTGDAGTTGYYANGTAAWLFGSDPTKGGIVSSIVNTSGGSTISYSIGAGGSGAAGYGPSGGAGGSGRIDIEYWA